MAMRSSGRAVAAARLCTCATSSTTSAGLPTALAAVRTFTSSSASQSKTPQYEGHVPLSAFQKAFMTVGSALASLHNPARADMIATLSETSGERFLPRLRDQMLATAEGRALLVDQPTINSRTVSMDHLRSLPDGSLGRAYVDWLEWCGVTPDTRAPVQYVDDPELRYVMQRYREAHDLYHLLCLMPTSLLGETVVKYFEYSHFGLPVALLSSIGGPIRLITSPNENTRKQVLDPLFTKLIPWAVRMGTQVKPLIGIRWEDRWEQNFGELRRELGFEDPPVRVEYERKKNGGKRKAWSSQVVSAQQQRAAAAEAAAAAAAAEAQHVNSSASPSSSAAPSSPTSQHP
ncbi:Ubiquinone biosynthesis protein [Tilletia horrida]|uniref:4-hydroxy-3-methoxy-5-polyprenylbenzoate decarboxylase n=1 Tax=Tilletia horrida TaxID=155126 RepID=A0AAN6GLW2_9BASI|nr:Ubiquinone biosynthesis protein [Tilletia horrida]